MRKILPFVVVLVLAALAVGGWALMRADDEASDSMATTQTHDEAENQSQASTETPAEEPTSADSSAADTQHLSGANLGQTVVATGQSEVIITMSDFKFDTSRLTISKGTKVIWKNEGDMQHNAVPSSDSPKTFDGIDLLANGETGEFTFTDVGKYYYFCSPHSTQMRGIIEVVD